MGSGLSRRHFFYGSLLAGAVPVAGFGSSPSLKTLGYKSPNEKLNVASIGGGGQAASGGALKKRPTGDAMAAVLAMFAVRTHFSSFSPPRVVGGRSPPVGAS